jgi:electron transfer flavoprotein beta subunit
LPLSSGRRPPLDHSPELHETQMNIVACVKRVPVTEAQAVVAADGASLDTRAFQYMLSFYDEIALEAAVQAKEKLGGEVIALTLGSADASKELRECLAKGADRALILKDERWDARDPRSTAKALARQIQALDASLVFCGRVATDRDHAAVGPMLATFLGWACVTEVNQLELGPGGGHAKRETEAGIETVEFALPAVITCNKDLNQPRYAGLKGIMAAKKKPIEELPAADEPNQAVVARLELPPPRKEGRILGKGVEAIPALIDALRNEAGVL